MLCKYCKKDVQSLALHVSECLGINYATPTYVKNESVIERVFHHRPAKVNKNLLLQDDNDTMIVFTGDWHVGNSGTNHHQLICDLNLLKQYPQIKIVFMGDMIDNYIPGAPGGGSHDAVARVSDQKKIVEAISKGLKNQVVGVIQGCHEEWSFKEDDFDFADWMANTLDTCYLGFGGLIHLVAGDNSYDIGVAHKFRGGYVNPTSVGVNLYREIGPFDVGVTAHVHKPSMGVFEEQGRFIHVLTCGSYKEEDRHVARMRITPVVPTMPAVIFKAKERKILSFFDFKDALPNFESMLGLRLLKKVVKNEVANPSSPAPESDQSP